MGSACASGPKKKEEISSPQKDKKVLIYQPSLEPLTENLNYLFLPQKIPNEEISITIHSITYLFNLLSFHVKKNRISINKELSLFELIELTKENALLNSALALDLEVLNKYEANERKNFKMLMDFKNIVVPKCNEPDRIDENIKEFIDFLKETNTNVKGLKFIRENITVFINKFPYFSNSEQTKKEIESAKFPILVFNSDDLDKKGKQIDVSETIFIEDSNRFEPIYNKNQNFYSKILGITKIIRHNQENLPKNDDNMIIDINFFDKNMKYNFEKIINTKSGKILFIFPFSETKTIVSLINLIARCLNCSNQDYFKYFLASIPKGISLFQTLYELKINQDSPFFQIEKKEKKNKGSARTLTNEGELKNRCEQMTIVIRKLKKNEAGDILDILGLLLNNMINNYEEEKYKIVKINNEKLRKTIFSSDLSTALVELCGFIHDKNDYNIYKNVLSLIDLKMIKMDLELAIKNSSI